MGTRTTIALLGAVVAILVATVVLRSPGSVGTPIGSPAATSTRHDAIPNPAEGVVDTRAPVGDSDRSQLDRIAVDHAVTPTPEPARIRITIVDDTTGARVPGAEVVGFVEPTEPGRSEAFRHSLLDYRGAAPDPAELARRRGRVATTAEDGTVWVPLPAEASDPWRGIWIEAHASGRFGRLTCSVAEWTQRSADGVEIRVRPTSAVQIEVVDATGAPVPDITVLHLATTDREDREPRRRRSVSTLGRTDAEGRLEVAHFETHMEALRTDGAHLVESALTVRLCGADVAPVTLAIDPLPTVAVRLTLPPTGALRIELPEGSLHADWGLALVIDPLPDHGDSIDSYIARVRHNELLGPGDATHEAGAERLTFPHVAVGCRLRATLREWNNVELIDERFAGPTRQGETITVRLEVRTPVLTGRFVDRGQQPVLARFDVTTAAGGGRECEVQAAADGRFRLPVQADLVGAPGTIWELFSVAESLGPIVARIEVSGPLRAGEIEVGDVLVEPLPVLATGRCIDDVGTPIEQPDIDASGVEAEPATEDLPYVQRMRRAVAVVARDGTFKVCGTFDGAELQLVASAVRHVMPDRPVRVRVGSTDITLVIARAAGLTATAIELREAHDLVAQLVRDDVDVVPATRYDFADGTLTWNWSQIPAGRYRFELRFGPTAEPLISVDDVVLEPGSRCRDPRLQGLRVPQIRTFRLRLVEPDGTALVLDGSDWAQRRGAHVFFRVGDEWHGRSLSSGVETLVNATLPPVHLLVIAPGRRPTFAIWTDGELSVPLARAPRVVVRIPDDARIDSLALRGGPGLRLVTYGGSDLGSLGRWPGMTARSPVDHEACFVVPEPGRYTIELSGVDAGAFQPQVIDIGDEPLVEVDLHR